MALQNVNGKSVDFSQKSDYPIFMFTGDDIKAIRTRLNLTPTAFAARCGVSASTICLWEQGHRHPRYAKMVLLNNLDRESKITTHPRKRIAAAS